MGISPKVDRKTKVDILLNRIRTEEAVLPSMLTLPEDMLVKDAIQRCEYVEYIYTSIWKSYKLIALHPSIHAVELSKRQTTVILSLISFSDSLSEFAVVTPAAVRTLCIGDLRSRREMKTSSSGRATDIVGIVSLHDVVSVIEQVVDISIMSFDSPLSYL